MRDDGLVAVDHARFQPADRRVFVVRTDDGLVVKRLRRRGTAWEMVRDNPAYEPRALGDNDQSIGQVAGVNTPRGGFRGSRGG